MTTVIHLNKLKFVNRVLLILIVGYSLLSFFSISVLSAEAQAEARAKAGAEPEQLKHRQERANEARRTGTKSLNVIMNRRIENQGFHRYMTTEIMFEVDGLEEYARVYKSCQWLLVESFGTSVYVDAYELRQNVYLQMYKFILSNKVNTETAEYKSQRFKLYLYINKKIMNCGLTASSSSSSTFVLNSTATVSFNVASGAQAANNNTALTGNKKTEGKYCRIFIKLPIHMRYHAPSSDDNQHQQQQQKQQQQQQQQHAMYFNWTQRRPRLYVTNCTAYLNTDTGIIRTKNSSKGSSDDYSYDEDDEGDEDDSDKTKNNDEGESQGGKGGERYYKIIYAFYFLLFFP
jgi:hypothetical protein